MTTPVRNVATFCPIQKVLQGPDITVTRPNNVTAYAANNIVGASPDARIQFPAPAAPADLAYGYNMLVVRLVDRNGSAALSLWLFLFNAAPTQFADQQVYVFSDADINALLGFHMSVSNQGTTTNPAFSSWPPLNTGAGAAGRKQVLFPFWRPTSTGLTAILSPGATYWGYLVSLGANTPLANEVFVLTPFWYYIAHGT